MLCFGSFLCRDSVSAAQEGAGGMRGGFFLVFNVLRTFTNEEKFGRVLTKKSASERFMNVCSLKTEKEVKMHVLFSQERF